jgi:integrase/recombinase XerC
MADGRCALAPAEAVDAVAAFLASDESVTEQSFERLVELMGRFSSFVENGCGVSDLRDVSASFVSQFVNAPTRAGGRPSHSTRHLRRCAVRLLFRTAREMGLADTDPTLDMRLEARRPSGARPLTEEEIGRCRLSAVATLESTRLPAAWALAEAGVRTGELSRVTIGDLNLKEATVQAPGCRSAAARTADLTPWGAAHLRRRVLALGCDPAQPVIYTGDGSAKSQQAAACIAISTTLIRAGLGDDPEVRPVSVAAWAGAKVLEETGRIEVAAERLGMRSLDRTARLIGLDTAGGR